jgi:hypothetical protein
MITMQMADEDVHDLTHPDPVPFQVHLGSFTAIDQKQTVAVIYHLGRQISRAGRKGGTAPQYRYFKFLHHERLLHA